MGFVRANSSLWATRKGSHNRAGARHGTAGPSAGCRLGCTAQSLPGAVMSGVWSLRQRVTSGSGGLHSMKQRPDSTADQRGCQLHI
jgi:hypothetical protein